MKRAIDTKIEKVPIYCCHGTPPSSSRFRGRTKPNRILPPCGRRGRAYRGGRTFRIRGQILGAGRSKEKSNVGEDIDSQSTTSNVVNLLRLMPKTFPSVTTQRHGSAISLPFFWNWNNNVYFPKPDFSALLLMYP